MAGATVAVMASCSGSDEQQAAAQPASITRDLATYDAFVIASAENNILFADVYAVRFSPFTVDRITTDKRISSLGADADHVAVAAADTDVDRLALVNGDGTLTPVPGLGRPFAYNPHVADGVMFYEDIKGPEDNEINRYFRWNLAKQTKTTLFRSKEEFAGITPFSNRSFVFAGKTGQGTGEDAIVVRNRSGELTRYRVGGDSGSMSVGKNQVATNLLADGDGFNVGAESIVLITLANGKRTVVPGLQAICWTPDGTRLLARRTTSPTTSELVLLDPAKPDQLTEIGTAPNLVIYGGTWVRNNP